MHFKRILILYVYLVIFSAFSHAQSEDSIRLNVDLDEVEIIGQRTPAVYSRLAREISIISGEEISKSPSSTIQDLLEYVPFADIRQRNVHGVQADIQLRGGTFDQVMILLNGINITDPQTGHFNLDLPVGVNSIERIEMLHGSGARLYGANAYKGVINIITRKNYNGVTAGIDYGQHGLFRSFVTAGTVKGKLFNNFSISRNVSEGFTDNTDYKIMNFFYGGGITGHKVNVEWQAGTGGKEFGANDFYSPSFPEQYEETSSKFASLGFNTKGKVKVSGTGYWRRHNDHFLLKRHDPSFYENFHRTDVFGLRLNAVFKSNLGKTSFGSEIRHEGILSSSLGKDMNFPVKINGRDSLYYDKTYSRNTTGFFAEHNIAINNFSVTGGFLLDINSDLNKVSLFPGMDISYKILDQILKVFVSVNRSLRLPTFTDMFYKDPANEGNPGLKAEKLLAFETGMDFRLNNYSAGITLFRDLGQDVIDWVWHTDDQKYRAMNITEITTKGIEVRSDYNLKGRRSFSVDKIGIAYSFIDLKKATPDYESKYSLDHLKHKLQISLSQNVATRVGAEWRISYFYRNGSYLDYDITSRTTFSTPFKPYLLVDAKLYYKAEKITVHFNVSNLFDSKYTDIGSLIQPGRWITGGIQFNFLLSNP